MSDVSNQSIQNEEISQLILMSGFSSTSVMNSTNESIVSNQTLPEEFVVDKNDRIHIFDNVTSYSIDVTDLR